MAFLPAPASLSHGDRQRCAKRCAKRCARRSPKTGPVRMLSDPAAVAPATEIVVGSVALAIPFFVAAVLFGERIYRQRTCAQCNGSGLVAMGPRFQKRCPKCGGFLPWQSWRRFFTG